jgi:ribosomal protein L31E
MPFMAEIIVGAIRSECQRHVVVERERHQITPDVGARVYCESIELKGKKFLVYVRHAAEMKMSVSIMEEGESAEGTL